MVSNNKIVYYCGLFSDGLVLKTKNKYKKNNHKLKLFSLMNSTV